MDFKILDASAFYSGIPFGGMETYYTTDLVFDEIKHIKDNHDAIGMLLETGRLKIIEPDRENIEFVINKAKKTGDFNQLSKEDISLLALSWQLKGNLVTDDFAISNVAKYMNLKVYPVMTSGIQDKGKWIHYCNGCHKNFEKGKICPLCGNSLKRKLIKKNLQAN